MMPLLLAAAAYLIALLQRPGVAAADTKIDLHVDPGGFLGDAASVWSSSGGLGQVQAGQYSGYLFPMGPFHAGGDALGLSPWLVERLWLGTLLALGAWGVVRLLDAMLDRERGAAHLTAGALMLLNPYVTVLANRTSITLLGYVALPWLLLCVHRGLREPRGWWWPAAVALVVASTGGGVNAAVTAWVLVGPALLLVYEAGTGAARWRDAGALAARAAPLCVLASLWWIVPVAEHARHGLNFLPFTESVGAIWATTGLSESLRGMGYWISYLGTGFGDRLHPYFDTSGTLLFDLPVVLATLLVPALALAGFVFTRRLRYGPFFLALALVGTLAVGAGFPDGTPLRRALTFAYNHAEAVQFLRTSYKAGALVAVAVACLGGMAAGELWRRLPDRLPARAATAAVAAVLVALAAWPLVRGRAIDGQVAYGHVAGAWTRTARELDRGLPPSSRALVLPGQPFSFYRWGGTQDPILPALTARPVAVRTTVPYSDLHAADLLITTDALVQQRRVLPGQLRPLVELLGARTVVTGSDDDPARSGAIEPAVAATLLREGGLGRPTSPRGAARRFRPGAGELGPALALPEVRRYEVPGARGMVRVEPAGPELLVDGSAAGLAGLAALGALPRDRPIAYAGDRSPGELRRAAEAGADLVVTDTNRRRVFLSSRARQTAGATLGPEDPISADAAVLDPFPGRGVAAQTVAGYDGGVRYVRGPFSPNFPQFPEHRPYAAFDGSPATHWAADRHLDDDRHWVEIGFTAPRRVPWIDVLPREVDAATVKGVTVAGRRYEVHAGWNRLPVGLTAASSLRVGIAGVTGPEERGAGALAEVRVPGLRPREFDRTPSLLTRALDGRALARSSLAYVFARETGDDPLRRNPAQGGGGPPPTGDRNPELAAVARAGDAEAGLSRVFDLPAPRSFRLDALVSVAPDAPDPVLDRLAGQRGSVRYESSSRLEGMPGRRASKAFDGDPHSAWIAATASGAWVGWRTRRALTLRTFVLESAEAEVSAPSAVRVRWPGGRTPPLPVSPSGEVDLPRAVASRSFRVEVASVVGPRRAPGTAPGAAGISELRVPGLAPSPPAGRGALRGGCAIELRVGGRRVRLRPRGTVAALDAGSSLRARACGGTPLRLTRGRQHLQTGPGTFRVNLLRMRSPAPAGLPAARGGGVVLDPGRAGRGRYDGVRLASAGPAWLVLGESFNRGWRAWCDGRSHGEPAVVDGYANGWRLRDGCVGARFAFAPNSVARASYWTSGLACLLMLGLLAGGWRRRRTDLRLPPFPDWPARAADRPPPVPLARALAVGALAGSVCGFVFALRAGVVAGPLVALVLWRGVGARALILAAGGLLAVVVPAIYLLFLPRDDGGFNSDYAEDLLGAHWVAVAAWLLLATALVRTLAPLRRRAGDPRAARR